MIGLGYGLKHRTTILIGIVTAILGISFGFDDLITILFSGNWVVLGSLGVIAIILGSILERHGVAVKLWIKQRLHKQV